jgi:two-component system, chemotaxis family, response regulator PixG
MNTMPTLGYRPFQRIHPLSLLAQMSSRQTSGRLQVTSEATVWSLYLDQGQLVYATNLVDPFERLDRHLQQIGREVSTIVSALRVQVRLLFEQVGRSQYSPDPDYRAICWLVEQNYLTPSQAANLIDGLAKEVMEGFLAVKAGTHDVVDRVHLESYPDFCRMDLRSLVEYCQGRLRQAQATTMNSVAPVNVQNQGLIPSNPSNMSPGLAGLGASGLGGATISREPSDRLSATVIPVEETTGLRSSAASVVDRDISSVGSSVGSSAGSSVGNGVSGTSSQSQSKGHYTIVCIDDSPTVLQAISCFLDDKSFSVVMVNDPVKALMQVVRSKPDLILLDVGMPNLDGYELCRLLRRHPTFKNLPIIMVTGHTGFLDRAKAKLVGSSGYLTKPFTQSDLLKIIFQHLS